MTHMQAEGSVDTGKLNVVILLKFNANRIKKGQSKYKTQEEKKHISKKDFHNFCIINTNMVYSMYVSSAIL